MYSFNCQICGVDMATARIRTPDEPPSAAWNFEGADYVGFTDWPYQGEFDDAFCRQCPTADRGPARPPEVNACWPVPADEDDPDWTPDAQSSSDEEPLEYDSGWETDSDGIEPEASSFSGKEDSHYSNDAPDRYPLSDLYASPDLDRLPHGTWHNGRAYYSGNRKYPQSWSLQTINHSNVLPEHIASPSCQSLQGISGHVLSVAQMKNSHSFCLDIYAKLSLRRLGYVDLNGLWHWREMRNMPTSYGLVDRIPEPTRRQLHLPELQRARQDWDYPWLHNPGDEWIVANPVEIPGISRVLESCMKDLCIEGYTQQTTGFLALPAEIIQHTLSFLDVLDVDSAAKTCRAMFKLAQPLFRETVLRGMPWLWEVLENIAYPMSRDCLPTWDPLCPLGVPPPILPVGLETEEEEESRWALILFEDPEMDQVRNATKAANRQRREEIITPYHERLKTLLKDWHSFRRNVEAWIHGKGERRDINWRRVWFLFNPLTSPLPGIRNRARIWEDCESIMDFVALAREGEDMGERHKELETKISELVDENSYGMPDTDPDFPSWLQTNSYWKTPAVHIFPGMIFDEENLPGRWAVWASTPQAAFLRGRFAWAAWDVDELSSGDIRKRIDVHADFLTLKLIGL
ncbi:hypothetical protein LZL87_011838 [Fusarium oxysporum]|nr:hypothetical protein LZL87_011838 [Fusarium oxysporum]